MGETCAAPTLIVEPGMVGCSINMEATEIIPVAGRHGLSRRESQPMRPLNLKAENLRNELLGELSRLNDLSASLLRR